MWLKKLRAGLMLLMVVFAFKPAVAEIAIDETPDSPEGFGYKVNWFAVKTIDPQLVATSLGLNGLRRANWASGISAAYSISTKPAAKRSVFISPPVKGWILVVSNSLPYPDKRVAAGNTEIDSRFEAMFKKLASSFEDVQFFGSYRVVGFEAWARARAGKIERFFCYADGEVYANYGLQTAAEKQLKFADLSNMSPEIATSTIFSLVEKREAEEARLVATGLSFEEARRKSNQHQRGPIPTEGDAMAIAGQWSIDPTRIEELKLPASTGFVAVLPSHMQQ